MRFDVSDDFTAAAAATPPIEPGEAPQDEDGVPSAADENDGAGV